MSDSQAHVRPGKLVQTTPAFLSRIASLPIRRDEGTNTCQGGLRVHCCPTTLCRCGAYGWNPQWQILLFGTDEQRERSHRCALNVPPPRRLGLPGVGVCVWPVWDPANAHHTQFVWSVVATTVAITAAEPLACPHIPSTTAKHSPLHETERV
jgi:hypothetical protein